MPKVATITHPLLRQFLRRRQRPMKEAQARAQLARIGAMFITSRDGRKIDGFRIWVRGFGLGHAEKIDGYVGHFVIFQLVEDPDGWRIAALKDQVPLAQHPERARPPGGMPNWGFPVLRSIKKGRVFYSEAEAKDHLQQLIDAYPKSCKVSQNTLKLRVYTRHPDHGPMFEKILIKPLKDEQGMWKLDWMVDPGHTQSRMLQMEDSGVVGAATQAVLTRKAKPKVKRTAKMLMDRARAERIGREKTGEPAEAVD